MNQELCLVFGNYLLPSLRLSEKLQVTDQVLVELRFVGTCDSMIWNQDISEADLLSSNG
jgi:hypothetical protein